MFKSSGIILKMWLIWVSIALFSLPFAKAEVAYKAFSQYPIVQKNPVGNGLKAEYFNGTDFQQKIYTRIDKKLDFYLLHQSPAPGVDAEDFSVRWTGKLLAPTSGTYTLIVHVDDGIRLWLDGKKLFDAWHLQETTSYRQDVKLVAGRYYDLKVEYYNSPDHAVMRLAWESPTNALFNLFGFSFFSSEEIIPSQYLFSVPEKSDAVATLPPAKKEIVKPLPKPEKKVVKPTVKPSVTRITRASINTTAKQLAYLAAPLASKNTAIKVNQPSGRKDSIAVTDLAMIVPKETFDNLETGKANVLKHVYFEQSKSLLLPTSYPELDKLVYTLQKNENFKIEIAGHTDNRGSSVANKALSLERADMIAAYLVKHGIRRNRIKTLGYGDQKPIAANSNEAERAKNRRVEFTLQTK